MTDFLSRFGPSSFLKPIGFRHHFGWLRRKRKRKKSPFFCFVVRTSSFFLDPVSMTSLVSGSSSLIPFLLFQIVLLFHDEWRVNLTAPTTGFVSGTEPVFNFIDDDVVPSEAEAGQNAPDG